MTAVENGGVVVHSSAGHPTPGLLSPDIDLDHLTEAERQAIYSVIRRDEAIRKKELESIETIRQDISRMVELEKRLDLDDHLKVDNKNDSRMCSRCKAEFGWLFNRGDVCSKCHQKVCEKCRHLVTTKEKWLCTLCFKRAELETWTAAWLKESMRRSRRRGREGGDTKRDDTPHPETTNQLPVTTTTLQREANEKLEVNGNRIDLPNGHSGAISDDDQIITLEQVEQREDSSPSTDDQLQGGVTVGEASTDNVVYSTHSLQSNKSNRSNISSPTIRSQFSVGSGDSVNSAYSNMGRVSYGNFPARGEIELSFQYVEGKGRFEVTIRQCKDLTPVHIEKNQSNPYVKIYLLPDKSKNGKRKTRIRNRTVAPVFNEQFYFSLSRNELRTRTLWVAVWHNEMFGKNEFLSDVAIPLMDQSCSDNTAHWYKLQQEGGGNWKSVLSLIHEGELSLALRWVKGEAGKTVNKNNAELHVTIRAAKNLASVKMGGHSNIFCKCLLLPQMVSHKTPIVKNDLNPTFNHTVSFTGLPNDRLDSMCLEITVWEYSRTRSNDFLGGIRLNNGPDASGKNKNKWMDASATEAAVWRKIGNNPGKFVEEMVQLRLDMEATT